MRPLDIDALSEDELIELNHKVVARLRFLSQMRSHSAMLDFRVGERVLVTGGYDADPDWLRGRAGYTGTLIDIRGSWATWLDWASPP